MTTCENKIKIKLEVNGQNISEEVEPGLLLIDFLRDRLGLTGAKKGCGEGICGACTVIINGKTAVSCLTLAASVDGCKIETIEGISKNGLTQFQKNLIEEGGIQCGFCTPGIVVSAEALLRKNPKPNEEQTKEALSGNLCRCTGYKRIINAIKK